MKNIKGCASSAPTESCYDCTWKLHLQALSSQFISNWSEYLFRYSPHAKTINHSNSNLSLPTQPEHTTHKNLKWFTRFQVSPCHGSTVPHMTPPKDVCKYLYARIPKRNPCFAKTKVGPFPALQYLSVLMINHDVVRFDISVHDSHAMAVI